MPRWPRGRRVDKTEPTRSASPSDPSRQPGRRRAVAPEVERPAGAAWDRPPSAAELRAAFKKKRQVAPEPPEKKSEFEELFPREALYAQPGDVEPDDERDIEAEADPIDRPVNHYYEPDDPWDVLEIDRTATWPEVVAAHRQLALRFHPDRLPDATEAELAAADGRIREINIAYSSIRRRMGR